jgi:hypothetical protein
MPNPEPLFVMEYCAHTCGCSCGAYTQADFPEGITAHVQYGPRITALAVYLQTCQFIPEDRTAELMKDVFGIDISTISPWRASSTHCATPCFCACKAAGTTSCAFLSTPAYPSPISYVEGTFGDCSMRWAALCMACGGQPPHIGLAVLKRLLHV